MNTGNMIDILSNIWRSPRKNGLTPKTYTTLALVVMGVNPLFLGRIHLTYGIINTT